MAREQELIESAKNGDAQARKAIYSLYVGYLHAVCSRYITGPDDVKDTLQDAFIKIFQSLGSFQWRGEGSLKSWMTRVVVNECLKRLRSGKKDGVLVFPDNLPDVPEEEVDDDEISVENVPAEVIHSLIRELPEGYRTIFNLFVIEGRSHREIAGLLGIGESSSASQFHRAKKILASKIKEYLRKNSG